MSNTNQSFYSSLSSFFFSFTSGLRPLAGAAQSELRKLKPAVRPDFLSTSPLSSRLSSIPPQFQRKRAPRGSPSLSSSRIKSPYIYLKVGNQALRDSRFTRIHTQLGPRSHVGEFSSAQVLRLLKGDLQKKKVEMRKTTDRSDTRWPPCYNFFPPVSTCNASRTVSKVSSEG